MFCKNCGSEISDSNSAFCPKCGASVSGAPAPTAASKSPTVPNHLVGAILTTIFCCQIGGIVAIVYAAMVNTKLAQGDVAGAEAASKTAKKWIIASIIVGAVIAVFYLVVACIGAATK